MQTSTSTDPEQAARDLLTSISPLRRREAAAELGRLPCSNPEIVRALVAAEALDDDPVVRSRAGQALQSPVHQTFIQQNPDLMHEAIELGARTRATTQREADNWVIEEFLRRRRRERLIYIGLFAFLGLWFAAMFALLPLGHLSILSADPVGILITVGLFFWLSWRNWRCPACESWLGGWRAPVNAFFSSQPLWCPHCGSKLL